MSDLLHPCATCGALTYKRNRICANCFFALGDPDPYEPDELEEDDQE